MLPQYRGSIEPTVTGIIGHSCLLVFFVVTTFIYASGKHLIKFSNSVDHRWLNIMCIIGQIGMMSIYYIEYIKVNNKELYNKYIDYYKYIHIITFSLLAYFYYRVAYKKKAENHILFYPFLMVSILYSIFLYEPLHDYILDLGYEP